MPKRKPDDEEIIGTSDASHILECSAETIRLWCKKGTLVPFIQTTGGTRLFKRAEIEKLAAERRKGPKSAKAQE